MEERIIDDEYGRGIKLKKTKDGYVDVTDALVEDGEMPVEDEGEEVSFEFPMLDTDEDDEDLVGLTPEEAAKVRKQKEEEIAKRKADYEQACKEGEELLETGSFKAAELKFEKALTLDQIATDASVGYWRAKTANFTQPDVLIAEYAEAGIESLEYDLGLTAVEKIKETYQDVFKKRVQELKAEEKPLAQEVEEKQSARREVLNERMKKRTIAFLIALLPTLALLVLTLVCGLKNFTTRGDEYIVPTVILGAVFFVCFICFILVANKWINAFRIRSANEKLSSTEEGKRLLELRDFIEIYECLLVAEDTQTSEN